jgi:hypothetical protein
MLAARTTSFSTEILDHFNTTVRGWRLTALWKGRMTALIKNREWRFWKISAPLA